MRRYYVDWADLTYPSIQAVGPDDEDYEYAHRTLSAAKKSIVDSMKRKIAEAHEVIQHTRSLRVADLYEEA
ncbi:hypothetical protein [Streptomyces roseochromogenus]|uniref:Uncharacterized protein n=1 Tax=Streptomyces roseochromogenus subsp. oscitans DS 12.976 TaxID=1352936 RepID=V6JDT9_STRRC|nr:hypothetical protein [Streptomyces roseochromogenus]EST18067.1 hypothetical protein M878_45730 [Streptomyces roseochromogenus subsp. oscitans DS 12.976]